VLSVTTAQTINETDTATIEALGVTDDDGVGRVWAVARPPDYEQGTSGNPTLDLPTFNLQSQGDGNYSGTWDGFTAAGTYQLAVYASDRIGNTSVPKLTTVSVNNPRTRQAILLAASASNDPLFEIAGASADLAYEALVQQGYDDDAIYYMNASGTAGVDVSPTLSNLEFAITRLSGDDTQDLMLYIVGSGDEEAIFINETEALTPSQLADWLDEINDSLPGNISVVLDSDSSGSFIPELSADKRIIVTSSAANQPAHFFSEGDISFSGFYWRKIFNGGSVRDAWLFATRAMRFAADVQEAQLDDDGDGIANSKTDGKLARLQRHGAGILLAGDEPLINTISAAQSVSLGGRTAIAVEEVITTGEISMVTAFITSPNKVTAAYPLLETNASYSTDNIVFELEGTYEIAVYAEDESGNVSLPISTTVTVTGEGINLDLRTNQTNYRTGDTLQLFVEASVENMRSYIGPVDVYFSIQLPDGTTFYLTDLAPIITIEAKPILSGWSPISFSETLLLSLPLPELPAGDYSWQFTFTKAGQSIVEPGSSLAQAVRMFDFE